MIPATHPFEARFKQSSRPNGEGTTYFTTLPVVAWDENGSPLVSDKQRLVPASSWGNFHDVVETAPPVVAVIPGGGWMVEYKDGDSTSAWKIVAWAIDAAGEMKPLSTDSTGYCDDATTAENFVRIYHPDEVVPE